MEESCPKESFSYCSSRETSIKRPRIRWIIRAGQWIHYNQNDDVMVWYHVTGDHFISNPALDCNNVLACEHTTKLIDQLQVLRCGKIGQNRQNRSWNLLIWQSHCYRQIISFTRLYSGIEGFPQYRSFVVDYRWRWCLHNSVTYWENCMSKTSIIHILSE
jgi:hypothetical protein